MSAFNTLSNEQKNWIETNTRFNELSNAEKNEVIILAESMMNWDSFFISMLNDGIDKQRVFISAIHTATNKFLKGKFHAKFGQRQL
jgi:hypothetical protein